MPPTSSARRWTQLRSNKDDDGERRRELQRCNPQMKSSTCWHGIPLRWHTRFRSSALCDLPLLLVSCDATGRDCMDLRGHALRIPARALAVVCLLLVSPLSSVLARGPSAQESVLPLSTPDAAQVPAPNKA